MTKPGFGTFRLGSPPGWMAKVRKPPEPFSNDPSNFWPYMEQQRWHLAQMWNGHDSRARALGTRIGAFTSRLVPRSFYALFVILFGLLAAGLIAPLCYLSARDDDSWKVLLGLFIPLAAAFVGYMAWELHRLRQASDFTRDTF